MTTSLNETPAANRPKLVIIGRRNAGKSSFINALTNQKIAIVSEVPGTTADPVYKFMEILPIGPVTIIDTAGLDDKGKLGKLRVEKTNDVLKTADFVFLVIAADTGLASFEKKMLDKLIAEKKKFCVIVNKIDLANFELPKKYKNLPIFYVSSLTGAGVKEVKDNLAKVFKPAQERHIIADLIDVEDIVVLVIPIDSSAPKGRIILPQVQTLREILDKNAVAMVAQNFELKYTIDNLKKK
ncbi:MAG TPA: GTP-binding protein, partial [bacterium]|nr:GTP-binding protein [bacterium]